jgi:hypothetical protein
MPKIVHVNLGMFDRPDRLAALTDVAALYELVLIGACHLMVNGRLTVLRQTLAPRRMAALIIDDDLSGIERTLVEDLLNDGVIPLLVAVGDQPTSPSMAWLEDDKPPAAGADHAHLDCRCVKGLTPLLRRRRRGPPRNDAEELRPAT